MKIDFSNGIQYWVDLVDQLLHILDDFIKKLGLGFTLFPEESEAPAEEPTTTGN